jgi:hypothetical protein
MKKIILSDVIKKDLRVLSYLVVFGGVTILAEKYLKVGDASILLGAVANYILYRIRTELEKEGYREALRAK